MDETIINHVYQRAEDMRRALLAAYEHANEVETHYDEEKALFVLSNAFDGKNEEVRKAQIIEHMIPGKIELQEARTDLNVAQADFDISKLEVARVQAIIAWVK
jgi:hypothetical protein